MMYSLPGSIFGGGPEFVITGLSVGENELECCEFDTLGSSV